MQLKDIIDLCVTAVIGKNVKKSFLQFFRYLICGGVATVCDMTVLFTLTYFFSVNHLYAAALAFVVGVATNYYLNTILVFQSSGKFKKEFPLFAMIGIGGLLWTEVILWIFVDKLDLQIMLAKVIAVILVLNWNFFMRKKFVFSSKHTEIAS